MSEVSGWDLLHPQVSQERTMNSFVKTAQGPGEAEGRVRRAGKANPQEGLGSSLWEPSDLAACCRAGDSWEEAASSGCAWAPGK